MFNRVSVLVAAAAISFGGLASAATLPGLTDSYEGTYNAESTNTGSNLHSIWLNNLFGYDSATDYWQFDSNGGVFDYHGGTASLTGTIVNNVYSDYKFAVDINFDYTQKGGRVPKCEFGAACGSSSYSDKSDQFEYFEFGDATLTGIDGLYGYTLSLSIAPSNGEYPPQLGYGANNKDIDEFGLSTWFFWTVTHDHGDAQTSLAYDSPFYKYYGRGDVNIELTPVPLPAALPLFLGALGLLGWTGRRRRAYV
jgi:hypothetical protein